MVSKEQKKMKKKKAREKDSKKKVLAKREQLRAKAREKRQEEKRDKRIKKLQNDMAGLDVWEDEVLKKMPDKTLEQLEHNAKILRAIEEDHEAEMGKKKKLNEDLEAAGHFTLDDKLGALQENTAEKQKKKFGLTGSADCRMTPAKPKKDTAEVEVVRAEKAEDTENSESS
jgi:hypothetical protein